MRMNRGNGMKKLLYESVKICRMNRKADGERVVKKQE
jgi:hypothetical protein